MTECSIWHVHVRISSNSQEGRRRLRLQVCGSAWDDATVADGRLSHSIVPSARCRKNTGGESMAVADTLCGVEFRQYFSPGGFCVLDHLRLDLRRPQYFPASRPIRTCRPRGPSSEPSRYRSNPVRWIHQYHRDGIPEFFLLIIFGFIWLAIGHWAHAKGCLLHGMR